MGTLIDATPFVDRDFKDISDKLETEYKFEKNANEVMYSGYYGCQMSCDIFIGPTYYQRLKHMVGDKINYRYADYKTIDNKETIKIAPYEFLTRQPTHGRGAEGGLRIGNMELDAINAHGSCAFIQESFMERSDAFVYEIDNKSKNIRSKVDATDVSRVRTPYTFKLLVQEMNAMGVKANILTTQPPDEEFTYDDFGEK